MQIEPHFPKVRIFIISWPGQHERAMRIADELQNVGARVFMVYSDPDDAVQLSGPFTAIRRSQTGFWEDKFQACIESVAEDYALIIHADCDCANWSQVYERYHQAVTEHRAIGVWAPKIEGIPYEWPRVTIAQMPKTGLHWVLQTDAVVFGLAPRVIQRMQRVVYGSNPYGWGIDRLFCAAAFVRQLWIVMDTTCQVRHPSTRGYDPEPAQRGMQDFFAQFDASERIYHQMCNEIFHARQAAKRQQL
jgi:hypothetical protein